MVQNSPDNPAYEKNRFVAICRYFKGRPLAKQYCYYCSFPFKSSGQSGPHLMQAVFSSKPKKCQASAFLIFNFLNLKVCVNRGTFDVTVYLAFSD